jgi:hypothetical protein
MFFCLKREKKSETFISIKKNRGMCYIKEREREREREGGKEP